MNYEGTAHTRRSSFGVQTTPSWMRSAVTVAPSGFDPASDGVCALRDGRIVCADPCALALLGAQSLAEIVGCRFADFVAPASRGRVADGLAQCRVAHCDDVRLMAVNGSQPGRIVDLVSAAAEDRALRFVFLRRAGPQGSAEKDIVHMSGDAGKNIADNTTVLICDDEIRLASLTAGLLEEYGFRPITAEQGDRALRLIREDATIRVLLLDVNLNAGLSARELLQSLAAGGPEPRVILTSGLAVEDVPDELIRHPSVAGYLAKPYSVEQLVESIRQASDSG